MTGTARRTQVEAMASALRLPPFRVRARVRRWLRGLVVAAAVAAFAPHPAAAQEDEATLVGVDEVTIQPMKQTVPVIGRLVASRTGVVAARVDAAVESFRVEVGDRVNSGEILAVLVADRFAWERELRRAEVREAEAAVATAEAEIALREQEFQRLEGLRRSAAFSQARLDDKRQEVVMAQSAASEAQAALLSAKARLRLAEIELGYTKVQAPYGGVVSQRHTEAGSYVDAGDPIVSLVDDTTLEIEADVPAERIPALEPGTPVVCDLNGRQLPATVRAVIPEENPLTRTRTVRFTPQFAGRLTHLAANQSVTLKLPAGAARNVVTVHKDAVLTRKGNTVVFLVDAEVAKVRPVRLGEAVGTRFQVLDGLQAGDRVVVRGNERLRPNQRIRTQGNSPG